MEILIVVSLAFLMYSLFRKKTELTLIAFILLSSIYYVVEGPAETYKDRLTIMSVIAGVILVFSITHFWIRRNETEEEKIKRIEKESQATKLRNDIKIKKRKAKELNTPLAKAKMQYYGGGLIERSQLISIEVLKSGIQYSTAKRENYFIDKEDIENVILDTQAQMSTHVKQRVTATRMFLLGPFALAAPKSKTTQVEKTSKFLGIDYNENGDKYTLLLEGEEAAKIQLAIRKMKNKSQ